MDYSIDLSEHMVSGLQSPVKVSANIYTDQPPYIVDDNKDKFVPPAKSPSLVLRSSPRGQGVVSTSYIKQDGFVCCIFGEIISKQRMKYRNRPQEVMKIQWTANVGKYYLDTQYYCNIGGFIEHSCSPNCSSFVMVQDSLPVIVVYSKVYTFCCSPHTTYSSLFPASSYTVSVPTIFAAIHRSWHPHHHRPVPKLSSKRICVQLWRP